MVAVCGHFKVSPNGSDLLPSQGPILILRLSPPHGEASFRESLESAWVILSCIRRGYVGLPPLATVRFIESIPSPICKDWLDSSISLRRCPVTPCRQSFEGCQHISAGALIQVSFERKAAHRGSVSLRELLPAAIEKGKHHLRKSVMR